MPTSDDGREKVVSAGPVQGPHENEDADPVGDGRADAELAATQPPEPALPNPQPDVPPSPLDDEPGERPDEPGEHRAREPGKAAFEQARAAQRVLSMA